MRFICTDPLNATSRVIDTVRRLGLEVAALSVSRRDSTTSLLCVELADPACPGARIFEARLHTLLDLMPEPENV